jgi:[protein-PII] uridylyltransferase
LTPNSDIDLLLVGQENAARQVQVAILESGLPIKARRPEDLKDWGRGLPILERTGLLEMRDLVGAPSATVREQAEMARRSLMTDHRALLFAMGLDAKRRAERFGGVSGLLEPQLKLQPGGLRDLFQGRTLLWLYASRLAPSAHVQATRRHVEILFTHYRDWFLVLRTWLGLNGSTRDLLPGALQPDLAKWMGYAKHADLMRDLHRGLARVGFYTDWLKASVVAPRSRQISAGELEIKSRSAALATLANESGPLVQARVRRWVDEQRVSTEPTPSGLARALLEVLLGARSERVVTGIVSTHLLDLFLPEFKRLRGYVQHDQYHRFTADQHILQVVLEVRRLRRKPARAFQLQKIVKSLSEVDWQILMWTALFHDLAKGTGGDHSSLGSEWARAWMSRAGVSSSVTDEVVWMVREHLTLSQAAFRMNSSALETWQHLEHRGVTPQRVVRLAVFTVADILGTNPEALTDWKSRLLGDMVKGLCSPESRKALEWGRALAQARLEPELLARVDGTLMSMMSGESARREWIRDFKRARAASMDLPALVRAGPPGQGLFWVRLHRKIDSPGVLRDFVGQLAALGLSIRHASVLSDPQAGVYDWFLVRAASGRSVLSRERIRRLLSKPVDPTSFPKWAGAKIGEFDITVATSESEWIVTFRGRDQRGLLLAASEALVQSGADIQWAKVSTWGQSVDDVFGIRPISKADPELGAHAPSAQDWLEMLRRHFVGSGLGVSV